MTTVKELREQLERLEALGMGEATIFFRDYHDFDHKVEQGIWDTCEDAVILG